MSFTVTKTYDDGTDFTEAQLDTAFASIEAKFNSTGITEDEIQSGAVTAAKLGSGAVTTAKIDSAAVTLAKLAAEVSAFLIPTGSIIPYGGASAPTGWLLCDGSAVSRTTYSALFGVIAETAGQGDNSTTFNVPDLRGKFLRGWDNSAGNDPNAGTRSAMATGGNSGDTIFSIQADATAINGISLTDGGHTHGSNNTLAAIHSEGFSGGGNSGNSNDLTATISSATTGITISSTDTETRPLNVATNFIIKT
jgi:microcystin-dependent protein